MARSKTQKPRKFFSKLFSFWLFDFDPKLKMETRKKETREKFCRFWRFQVFNLPLFKFFLSSVPDLSISSDRLSFFKLLVFFCFLFLFCLNLLFQTIVGCDYPTCKYMFKVTLIKSNMYYICSKFKKLTKMISVTTNRAWCKLR